MTEATSTVNGTSIPFVITSKMRSQLQGLGFSDVDVNGMKPSEAWSIINDNLDEIQQALNSSEQAKAPAAPIFVVPAADMIPQLPQTARHDQELARTASPWLDNYIAYSKKWAPNAYEGYHLGVALWVLATAAARRVGIPLGGIKYTGLYISMVGRTSVFTKTTAAKVGTKVLCAAGLNYLLCPDEMTPQAFIQHLAGSGIPKNHDDMPSIELEWHKNHAAFAGQKGWYYDEFGQKISGMMKEGGHMAEYRGILRRFDNDEDKYDYRSRTHGTEIVKKPYLALLGSMTPADLRKYAGKGAPLWNDGFWARFAFVSPGEDTPRKKGRWPNEVQTIPTGLTQPLMDWHKRLGTPHVAIIDPGDEDGKKKGTPYFEVADVEPTIIGLPSEVYEAFYAYKEALDDIVASGTIEDLDGNYSRLPEKAIRIAALLASFHGYEKIELKHWARAQEIAESWRVDLHSLYRQLSGDVEITRGRTVEDAIVSQIGRRGPLTARELRLYTNMSAEDVKTALPLLVADGTIVEIQEGRTCRYVLV